MLNGGRFGDNMMSYIHAKWISFKYHMPILYKPFPYSDQLYMHILDAHLSTVNIDEQFDKVKTIQSEKTIMYNDIHSTLFKSYYFPETKPGLKSKKHLLMTYFKVEWENKEYRAFLKETIRPFVEFPKWDLPKDKITVAVHVRDGGGVRSSQCLSNVA